MIKYLFLVSYLFYSFDGQAVECTPAMNMLPLSLAYPERSEFQDPVRVRYEMDNGDLLVTFLVSVPVLNKKDVFSEKNYPFQFDVTEVFLTMDDVTQKSFTYFEYELTPLNQSYNVRIDINEGKRTDTVLPAVVTTAQTSPDSWATRIRVPLTSLGSPPIDLSNLKGNFYAILGKNPRTYWSTFLPPQQKPNFHKPEHFKNLFDCTR